MGTRFRSLISLSCVLLLATACTPSNEHHQADYEPEAATGRAVNQLAFADSAMVSAAHPKAVEAGVEVLAAGGHAVDAAVAVQAMLTLVEPQSSGIGGGFFMLYWDAEKEQLHSLDARETAPQAAGPDLFLDAEGEAPEWLEAVVGGRSVGTPGTVAGLATAHERFGVRPWEELFTATIELAEEGFTVSERLARLLRLEFNPGVSQMPGTKEYFFPAGEPLEAGSRRANPALAESLRQIADQGPAAFYTGSLAAEIVAAVQDASIEPGLLTLADLADYEAIWRDPVCGPYRAHELCSMGPPSSGGITLLQTLGMLEPFDLAAKGPESALSAHLFTQASRLAFADRNRYIADSDHVEVPITELLDPDYLSERATLISRERDMGTAAPGELGLELAADNSLELPSTSHISIVDAAGNVVSMTTTIEMGFGSTVMAGGFLLNNQLTDFSLQPERNGQPVANRVEPGKRPRSSMAPVIGFDEQGAPHFAVGSPGGPRIINYVTQTILGLLDWELDMQAAIDMPRLTNLNGSTALEEDTPAELWYEALVEKGHEVEVRALNSGLHGILLESDGRLSGGADPRREGQAKGL